MMFRTRGAGFGAEVKRRIMLGTYALSAGYYDAYYGQAQKVRTLVIRDFEAAFERFDVLVVARRRRPPRSGSARRPTTRWRCTCTTSSRSPSNLSGTPAISIPCGLAPGLPSVSRSWAALRDEPTVLRAAYALEQDLRLRRLRPRARRGPS